jgi:hypothetical protein
MGKYTITSRDLKVPGGDPDTGADVFFTGKNIPLQGKHLNEGTINTDPLLRFVGVGEDTNFQMDAWLFEIKENVVPNWFGVGVPSTVREFSRPHVFFHPMPSAADLPDSVYRQKERDPGWVNIYRYVRLAGAQLAWAGIKQVFILPFFTTAAKDNLGVFAADWQDILSDILGQLNTAYASDVTANKLGQICKPHGAWVPDADDPCGPGGEPTDAARQQAAAAAAQNAKITDLVASSFSAGIKYLHTFINSGRGVSTYLREVYDIGGRESEFADLCRSVVPTRGRRVIRYDQWPFTPGRAAPDEFHMPMARWALCPHTLDIPTPPKTTKQVHRLMPVYCFYHAWTLSGVG